MQLTAAGSASPALRRFVRDTLGCTCSEPVFESVERSTLAGGPGAAVTRLVIGGRLLIYGVFGGVEAVRVAALAEVARRDRDAHGLNRFRLVVGLPADEGEAAALERAFRDAAGDDPKAHLHRVPAAALAEALFE